MYFIEITKVSIFTIKRSFHYLFYLPDAVGHSASSKLCRENIKNGGEYGICLADLRRYFFGNIANSIPLDSS